MPPERKNGKPAPACSGDWCVYVLQCRGDSLYIGSTNNLERRLKEHERGTGSKYVRSRRPFALVHIVPCGNSREARALEGVLKKLKRPKKIEVLGLRLAGPDVQKRPEAPVKTAKG